MFEKLYIICKVVRNYCTFRCVVFVVYSFAFTTSFHCILPCSTCYAFTVPPLILNILDVATPLPRSSSASFVCYPNISHFSGWSSVVHVEHSNFFHIFQYQSHLQFGCCCSWNNFFNEPLRTSREDNFAATWWSHVNGFGTDTKLVWEIKCPLLIKTCNEVKRSD